MRVPFIGLMFSFSYRVGSAFVRLHEAITDICCCAIRFLSILLSASYLSYRGSRHRARATPLDTAVRRFLGPFVPSSVFSFVLPYEKKEERRGGRNEEAVSVRSCVFAKRKKRQGKKEKKSCKFIQSRQSLRIVFPGKETVV